MINVIRKGDKLYVCLTANCRINDARLIEKVEAYKLAAGDLRQPVGKSYIVELEVKNIAEAKIGEVSTLTLKGDC